MNLQWGTVFYLSNGAQDIFFSGNVLFQPNRFFFTILCRRWIFNMYMNMFSMKEISASWKLFLSNSMLCVSFFRCFFLSESGLFLSESCLSNPFLISLSRPFSTNFPFRIFRLKIYSKIAITFFKSVRFKSFMISISIILNNSSCNIALLISHFLLYNFVKVQTWIYMSSSHKS